MHVSRLLPALAAGVLIAATAHAEFVAPRVSPNAVSKQTIGVTDLTLTYSRPGVKNRTIWGELVPYDKPWRTGANDATTFTATTDVTVGGQKLAAGTYSFFTIPSAKDWTIIFSKQHDLWGAFDYDPKQDALRVTATPTSAAAPTEWMFLGFDNLTPSSADLVIRWEKLAVAVPIQVDLTGTVLAKARAEVSAAKSDDWKTPLAAARWCFDSNVNLDEGRKWMQKSVQIMPGFSNLTLQARWEMKEGKKDAAIATAKKAIAAGKAATPPSDVTSTEKLMADWQAGKS
jgi:hypothetical protein